MVRMLKARVSNVTPRVGRLDPPATEAAGYKAQYTHSRWRRKRRAFLKDNPLCRFCEQQGQLTLATIVDHVIPHRGDERLFWDETNWQPLCKACHDGAKRAMERDGRAARGGHIQTANQDPPTA